MRCNILRYCNLQKSSNINHNITEKGQTYMVPNTVYVKGKRKEMRVEENKGKQSEMKLKDE